MKKNVFQGFNEFEAKQLETVKGGYYYRETGGGAVDEEYVTEAGETDPWNGGSYSYDSADARWEDCRP